MLNRILNFIGPGNNSEPALDQETLPERRFGTLDIAILQGKVPIGSSGCEENENTVYHREAKISFLGDRVPIECFSGLADDCLAIELNIRIQQASGEFKRVTLPTEVSSQILTYLNSDLELLPDESHDCGRFAFFAHSFWLTGSGDPDDKTYGLPADKFKGAIVDQPEPGDLLLFLNEDQEYKHFGVALGDGLTLAKMGADDGSFLVVSIDETHKAYQTTTIARIDKKYSCYQSCEL